MRRKRDAILAADAIVLDLVLLKAVWRPRCDVALDGWRAADVGNQPPAAVLVASAAACLKAEREERLRVLTFNERAVAVAQRS